MREIMITDNVVITAYFQHKVVKLVVRNSLLHSKSGCLENVCCQLTESSIFER
jgi:hypothetical protein